MNKAELTFDGFFKSGSRAFFPHFGYTVRTEEEIFKLPKKADVLLIELTEKAKRGNFTLLTH